MLQRLLLNICFIVEFITVGLGSGYWLENQYKNNVIQAHLKRYHKSIDYISNMSVASSFSNENITVCFISSKRNETGFEYLYQSIASIHYSLNKVNISSKFVIAFCGDETDDFLSNKFQTIHIKSPSIFPSEMCVKSNSYHAKLECIERYHFIKILNKTLSQLDKNGILLLLQDDALARPSAGYHIKWLLEHRLRHIRFQQPHIIKLFSPPHMHKYPIKFHDICELVAFIYILYYITRYVVNLKISTCLIVCLFACFICLVGGRQVLFEPRRIFPWLYTLKPSYECCIPAVLFTCPHSTLPPMIEFLKKPSKVQVDVVMSKYCNKAGIWDMTLEPNIFDHMGFDSSLSHRRSFKAFVNLIPNNFLGS